MGGNGNLNGMKHSGFYELWKNFNRQAGSNSAKDA
jgi:hypothetical protein